MRRANARFALTAILREYPACLQKPPMGQVVVMEAVGKQRLTLKALHEALCQDNDKRLFVTFFSATCFTCPSALARDLHLLTVPLFIVHAFCKGYSRVFGTFVQSFHCMKNLLHPASIHTLVDKKNSRCLHRHLSATSG